MRTLSLGFYLFTQFYLNVPSHARVNEIQTPDLSTFKEDFLFFCVCPHPYTHKKKIWITKVCIFYIKEARIKLTLAQSGTKATCTWHGQEPSFWVMELKDSSWVRKRYRARRGEQCEWGEGFCPARKLKPSQANWVQVLLVGKSRPINLVYYSVAVSLTEGHLGIQ